MADLNNITSLRDVITTEEKNNKIEEIKARIKADHRLQEIISSFEGMTSKTIEKSYAALSRYLDDKKICESCSGYDSCPKRSKPGHRIALNYDPFMDEITDNYVKCQYYRDILAYLKQFVTSDYDLIKGREIAQEAVKVIAYSKSSVENSFNKVAKTHIDKIKTFSKNKFNEGGFITCKNINGEALLFLLSNSYAKRGWTVAIIDASKTLTDCSSFDKIIKAEANERLEEAKSADCLFVTNLGFEYKSQAAKDLVLTPLLFSRNREGLITYFSSYMTIEELASSYARDKVTREMITSLFKNIVKQYYLEDIELFTK